MAGASMVVVLIINFFTLGMIAVTLAMAIVGNSSLTGSTYEYIYKLALNWNQGPIVDIVTVDNSQPCQNGYSPLINNKWEGTVLGCDCTNLLLGSGIRRRACSRGKNSGENSCLDIPPIAPMPYSLWKNSKICVKKIQNSYLDFTIVASADSCPSTMRICGIIDSLNNKLCIPTATKCPINKIQILQNSDPMPSDFQYTTIAMNNNNKLIYTTDNVSGKFPIDLIVSDGVPCEDIRYENYKSQPYILENYGFGASCPEPNEVSQNVLDNRYQLLDSYVRLSLYQENNIYLLLQRLPLIASTNYNYQTNLYSRNYIGFSTSCKNGLDPQYRDDLINDFLNVVNVISNSTYYSNGAFITAIIHI